MRITLWMTVGEQVLMKLKLEEESVTKLWMIRGRLLGVLAIHIFRNDKSNT